MKTVLICGATGFIGRNLTEYYSKKPGYKVKAVHNIRPNYFCDNVEWVQADLRNPSDLDRILEGVDIIIQAAATTSGSKDIVTRPYIHVTDNAVMNSLLFRAAFEKKVEHVVFFSCTVMYQSSDKLLKEEDFDANQPLYHRYFGVGHTKLYIEKMCEFFAQCGETKFTAIRHSNIYGPHDKYNLENSHVFGATVTKVMSAPESGTLSVWGTGEEERDLLHVDDLVSFVDLAISNQKEKFSLYNCGAGQGISIKDLVRQMISISGKKLKVEHDLSQPTIKTSLALDCSKAKNELGWEPKISLENGIKATLSWWSQNIATSFKKAS